ncbi:thioredoxin%2C bacteriocin transport accessory protein [Streptococcus pneumoniae]|nr:thioredoxin%2C bacteriocin transport accessory protein [Streptococcus pneumoniae]
MEQFLDNIKDLEVTTVVRAQEALDKKETATFFIGRKTCPYCRKFAGTLSGVVAETKAHIYFINSEEASQLNDFHFKHDFSLPGESQQPSFLNSDST